MPQTYPVVTLSSASAQADLPARTGETAIRLMGGNIRFAYGTETFVNAMPLQNGEGWIVPANTAVRVYWVSGEPRIYQVDK